MVELPIVPLEEMGLTGASIEAVADLIGAPWVTVSVGVPEAREGENGVGSIRDSLWLSQPAKVAKSHRVNKIVLEWNGIWRRHRLGGRKLKEYVPIKPNVWFAPGNALWIVAAVRD